VEKAFDNRKHHIIIASCDDAPSQSNIKNVATK